MTTTPSDVIPQDLTPIARYRVPNDDQPPDGPIQLGQLGQDIEQTTVAKFTNAAARDTAIPIPRNGQLAHLTATGVTTVYDTVAKTWGPLQVATPPKLVWYPMVLNPPWRNYSRGEPGSFQQGQFCKDAAGILRLRGLVTTDVATSNYIWLPPAWIYPSNLPPNGVPPLGGQRWFSQAGWGKLRDVDFSNGNFHTAGPADPGFVFLDSISFWVGGPSGP